jgi:hypothetical protein
MNKAFITGFAGGLLILSVFSATLSPAQEWKLIGITGQQSDRTLDGAGGFLHPDNTLYEINVTNGTITKLFRTTWVPDSHAIGYNPVTGLLFHSGGGAAREDDPTLTGHDQGGPPIPGLAFQDNYYLEAINLATQQPTPIFNANPCPNPDSTLPCFGLPAPRPAWALPAQRRNSTQTASSFRQEGPDEYSGLRGMAWSAQEKLFYVSDSDGIFKLTATGESTFLAQPSFPIDDAFDLAKAIAFVVTTNLLVGHRDGAIDPDDPLNSQDGYLMHINPDTGEVIGQIRVRYPEGGGAPVGSFGGLLGLSQNPATGLLYGLRKTDGNFARELVTINPQTGQTKLVANLKMHIAGIAFMQATDAEIHIDSITQAGGAVTLDWSGGAPKFLVRKKVDLNSSDWVNVQTTNERTVTINKGPSPTYFQIVGSYTGPDMP